MSIDSSAAIWSADAIECTPLLRVLQSIANDLDSIFRSQWSSPIHDLDLLFIGVGNIEMVDSTGGGKCQFSETDPLPEYHLLIEFHVFQSGLLIQIEYLNDSLVLSLSFGSECNDVLLWMHQCSICLIGFPGDQLLVLEIEDNQLLFSCCSGVPNSDILIRFKVGNTEFEVGWVDSQLCQSICLSNSDRFELIHF